MPEKDWIIKKISVSYDGVFDLNSLIKLIKGWLSKNYYFMYEKNYGDVQKDKNLSDIKIDIDSEREVDDYNRAHIDVKIKIKDLHNVNVNNKKLQKGQLKVEFESFLKKDIHSEWEVKPWLKILRAIYDRFLYNDKQKVIEEDLKAETYAIYSEVKSYLNLLNR
ncbi:hypothetical protein J4455_00835 [Candidatus Woesearchaeota archaeon]|nr:hypothetical protein [Candidatus Woesearchaeota archaeon]